MIYSMVPFPVTLGDRYPRFQGHGVIIDALNILDVLCAQLTLDLFAIVKFLFIRFYSNYGRIFSHFRDIQRQRMA